MAATDKRSTEIIINGKKAEASIKDLAAAARVLKQQMEKLPPASKEFAETQKELAGVRNRLKNIHQSTRDVQKGLEAGSEKVTFFTKVTRKLGDTFTTVAKGAIALFALEKIIAFGRELLNIEDHITKLNGAVQKYSGLTGEALSEASAKVQALSNTFDTETNEIIQAANVMQEQMGIGFTEALGLIEKGLVANIGKSDEFLEQVKEYSNQFHAAGASADEMIQVISQSIDQGIFSDKGADTIKEFGLRIREQTKATKTAMNDAFGSAFTDELFKSINTGKITTIQALREVSTKMNDTSIPANKLQTVIADVFGGPGEDAGLEFIKSLQDVDGNLESLIDSGNVYQQQLMARLTLEQELAMVEQELGVAMSGSTSIVTQMSTRLEILWKTVTLKVIKGLEYAKESTENWKAALFGLVAAAKTTIEELGRFFLKPFYDIGTAIRESLTGDIEAAKNRIQNMLKEVATAPVSALDRIGDAYATAFDKNLGAEALEKRQEKIKAQEESFQAEQVKAQEEQLKKLAALQHAATEKVGKKRKDAALEAQAFEQSLTELRIQLIEDDQKRELASLDAHYARRKAALKGNEEQITEQALLLEEEKKLKLDELRQKHREQEIEDRIEENELDKLMLEEKFLNGVLTAQQYEESLLDLRKTGLEEQLRLLKEAGKEETVQAQQLKNAIIKIAQEKADKEVEIEDNAQKRKKGLRDLDWKDVQQMGGMLVDFLDTMALAQQEQGKKGKALAKASILIQSALEIQRIWASVATLTPPLNGIFGGIATAAALLRTRQAIQNVNKQQFFRGGYTPNRQFAQGGHTFADGGMVFGRTQGEIGERGTEWVAPNWMVSQPPYANVIGALEAVRTNRLADGGATTSPTPTAGADVFQASVDNSEALLMELRRMNVNIENWPKQLRVWNSITEVDEMLRMLNQIRDEGDIR